METLVDVLVVIAAALSLSLLGWYLVNRPLEWSKADRLASELLRSMLTSDQYRQLIQQGYVDIPSLGHSQRVYRVPKLPGRVQVREEGQLLMWLCLQPLEQVPDADVVVIHKLMIEADEEAYLQKANATVPFCV